MRLGSPAPYGWPNVPFGSTRKPYSLLRRHKGKDWGWYYANPEKSRQVHAPAPGLVVAVYSDGAYRQGWGNYIEIRVSPSVVIRLCHLATGSIKVRVGDRVAAGQHVATMGNTGDTAGQVHLHEELWINGVRVNPDTYRGSAGKDLPGTVTGAPAGVPYPTPKPLPKGHTMDRIFVKAKGRAEIYELKDGKKRHLSPAEWAAINDGYARAGVKLPYSKDKLTAAQVASIPTAA